VSRALGFGSRLAVIAAGVETQLWEHFDSAPEAQLLGLGLDPVMAEHIAIDLHAASAHPGRCLATAHGYELAAGMPEGHLRLEFVEQVCGGREITAG
jgi:hypothetical protein